MVEQTSDASSKRTQHFALGRRGEELAAAYLIREGYSLVAANFSLPVGRNRAGALIQTEIDLVAYDGEVLCFVEVKTRASDWFAPPEVNVDRRKQRQVARAARAYRRMFGLEDARYRYDVVTVILPTDDEADDAVSDKQQAPKRKPEFQIQLFRNYWTEAVLKKRVWTDFFYDI